MKIKITKKEALSYAKTHTHVVCIEKGIERIVEKNGVTTLEIVTGKKEKITPRKLRILIRTLIQSSKKYNLKKIICELSYVDFPKCHRYDTAWFWSTVAENVLLADYEHTQYKSKKNTLLLTEILFVTPEEKDANAGILRGSVVAESANYARTISNTTGSDMTPSALASYAKKLCTGPKTKVTILDEKAITKLGMGGLIGVGKGSKYPPRFIIIEYDGRDSITKKKKEGVRPIVFVGKGITFDTGGLQVKVGMGMYEMHMDMSGGASVIATMHAVAKLGIKKYIVGLIPTAENAVSDEASRPGDVFTMMSGKTVEVLHTDAEGRIILADALHYAKRYNPTLLIDIATLTGASLVAVGQHAHVIITKNRTLEDQFRELGEESGDYTFPLPLWNEYMQYTKGTHADISNVASSHSGYGGTINGAAFLSHFTKKMPWVHIDMAPRMTSVVSDKLAKGATGEPTRLLIKIAEKY
jgi:leucyl aminopeptidase